MTERRYLPNRRFWRATSLAEQALADHVDWVCTAREWLRRLKDQAERNSPLCPGTRTHLRWVGRKARQEWAEYLKCKKIEAGLPPDDPMRGHGHA